MKLWRVKCVVYGTGVHDKYFVLQKRLFGFLWWYNPDNFNGSETGIYVNLNEVQTAYRKKVFQKIVIIMSADNTLSDFLL